MSKILELREKRAKAWEAAKKFLDSKRGEDGLLSAEDTAAYEKMEKEVVDLGKEIERLERQAAIDAELNKPTSEPITNKPNNHPDGEEKTGRATDNYRRTFWNAMRRKNFFDVENALQVGTDSEGGYLVPDEFEHTLVEALEEENCFRGLATVIQTSSGDRKIPVVASKGEAAWIDEEGAYPESDDSFGQVSIGAFKVATMIKVSDELLNDNVFNLEAYISKEFGRRIGTKEEEAFFMPNGGTLTVSGAAESFTADCYYNNGNSQSEPTTVPASPYTRKNMSFCGWSIDSLSTPAYKPGEKGVFPAGATLYAMWVTTEYDFPYTGNYVQFVIPQDGIYEFEVWGASGAAAKVDTLVAEGGLGGHSKGYKKMKKDEVVYVYNGGSPKGTSSGANGGGRGSSYVSSKQYGASGGGATHVATRYGELGYSSANGLGYSNRSHILIVAGGGGGGGIDNGTIHKGGDGGGERGGNGSGGALGGRQMSTSSSPSENFGMGDYYSSSGTASSGGGGGWFGGNYGLYGQSGAGGSGYVDGVAPFTHNGKYYPAETEAGVNEGHGKAFIRYVECA